MENKCEIVTDLLPIYIEKLTSEETKKFIEEHLKTCKKCKKLYEEMSSDLEKEELENTEIVKKIKSYKRKTIVIKLIIAIVLIVLALVVIPNIVFKYWVLTKAINKNIDYDIGYNYTIEEYADSIERYENHTTTYYLEGKMKKVYGDKLLEYYDGENHYYFDDEAKTYYVEEKVELNDKLNIDIKIFDEKNFENNFISKLKFILDKDIIIQEEGFRNKDYYVIKDLYGRRVYFDKETFIAERVEPLRTEGYTESEDKEYRVTRKQC